MRVRVSVSANATVPTKSPIVVAANAVRRSVARVLTSPRPSAASPGASGIRVPISPCSPVRLDHSRSPGFKTSLATKRHFSRPIGALNRRKRHPIGTGQPPLQYQLPAEDDGPGRPRSKPTVTSSSYTRSRIHSDTDRRATFSYLPACLFCNSSCRTSCGPASCMSPTASSACFHTPSGHL